MKYILEFACTLALSAVILLTPANAADPVYEDALVDQTPPEWTYEFSPYFWAPGVKGNIGLFGAPDAHTDVKFKDLFNAIDWSDFPPVFMGNGEITNGQFGFYGDLLHFSLNVDGTVSPPPIAVDLGLKMTIATAMGSYRVAEQNGSHLDLLAGARLWSVKADLDLRGTRFAKSFRDDETWVDPMIGVTGKYELSDTIFLKGWAMFGGFGVSSDSTWDLFGAVGYQYNDRISFQAGWRHIEVDYSKGTFFMDVGFDGPMLETTFRF
jgi:hypothetical protein